MFTNAGGMGLSDLGHFSGRSASEFDGGATETSFAIYTFGNKVTVLSTMFKFVMYPIETRPFIHF